MDEIIFQYTGGSYSVLFEDRLLEKAVGITKLRSVCPEARRIMLVSDTNVMPLYGNAVQEVFMFSGIDFRAVVFKAGESSKCQDTLNTLYREMSDFAMERTDCVLALGGGVVGDVAGYAAATYHRGVILVNAPTTVTAQSDSAYGGKCGINFAKYKNAIGTFYQPALVLCDTSTLKTLPTPELISGYGEIIKCAAIGDEELFCELEKNSATLDICVRRSCMVKRRFTMADERDIGLRHTLNFGHTAGHAAEAFSDYSIKHGEAVAMGMLFAAEFGERAGVTEGGTADRVRRLIKAYGLPCAKIPRDAFSYMLADKKRVGECINMVLLRRVGETVILPVDIKELEHFANCYGV